MGVFMDITERKRGEERLRESREQNEFLANVIILSSQPFGVGYLDGRLGLVNQAFEQLTGYTSEELHAIDWAKTLTPPEWVELEQQKLNELLETGQPVRYEKEYQRKDGTCVPIELLVHLVRDAAGNPQSYYSFITDITARKQAEKALRESEERFRILADSNPLIIWVTNAEGGVRFVNRTYREYFGVTLEQVEGKNWQPLLHPEDAPAYLEAFQTALREKKPFSAESRVRRADGVWRWLASYAEPRFSPEGEFLGFIGNSPDVTERKRYEDEIRASQARLLLTTEAAGVGVWSVNLPSMQVYCDDQVRQMLNLPDQAPLEIRFFERRIHPEDWARVEQIARQMLAAPQRLEVEFRVRPLEGDERWLSMRGQGQFDSQGQVSQLVGVMMDITEAKRIQEEIRSGLDRIEVQRRLLEQREQERLKIARDLHDGPVQELTGAHYALEGIIYTTEDEALGQGLQSIREVIKTQVAELRAFAGELRPPTLAKFGLGKALLSYAEEFQEKHPELKIQVEATQEGELLPQAVRLGLFRIFQESLQNIHKHAQATAVNVRLTKNSEIAALEIRDNGMGFDVPTDWLDLARQGHLGLVGMRERAEALGGQAVIISSPGQGTQVQVRVPFASATVPES
jgi:PAS domain S-box-containing protein